MPPPQGPPVSEQGEMSSTETLVFWGASTAGSSYIDNTDQKPLFFVDSDKSKWGTYFRGVPVLPPSYATGNASLRLVVTSVSAKEIVESAKQMGISASRIEIPSKSSLREQIFRDEDIRRVLATELSLVHRKFGAEARVVATGGTALGFFRDHDFIPWDFDCDFRLPFSFFEPLVAFVSRSKQVVSHQISTLGKLTVKARYFLEGVQLSLLHPSVDSVEFFWKIS